MFLDQQISNLHQYTKQKKSVKSNLTNFLIRFILLTLFLLDIIGTAHGKG